MFTTDLRQPSHLVSNTKSYDFVKVVILHILTNFRTTAEQG